MIARNYTLQAAAIAVNVWYPHNLVMTGTHPLDFAEIYSRFRSPISTIECGDRCAPFNELGAPFCCDISHAVPSAYLAEWEYLRVNSTMWRLWGKEDLKEKTRLHKQVPEGQLLIACQGYELCQRSFRSFSCRAFPFFPYITRQGEFDGMSYYWEYEDRCWVISNLWVVSLDYLAEFADAFEGLFEVMPEDKNNFLHQSMVMRRLFGRRHRAIPLLHRNGFAYKVSPRHGRMRRVSLESLPKFGPYKIAAELPFPDEK